MDNDIINIFELLRNGKISFNEIKKKCKLDKEQLQNVLYDLELKGIIYKDENDMYQNFPNDLIIGNIGLSKSGSYGLFVDSHRYSIKKENLDTALNNDIVVAKKESNGNYKVVKILQRNTKEIVCEVSEEKGIKKIKPCFVFQDFDINLSKDDLKKRTDGERIRVELSLDKFNGKYSGKYLGTIGYKNDPDIDLNSIAVANGFYPKFEQETLDAANKIPTEVRLEDLKGRLDLRNHNIFTIDGAHTKDMDDAVSIKKLENGNYELGVHIAHVSHYIKFDSPIYKEALKRGNSLYMNDTVIPMLPQIISNGICSLNENVDRLTRSVIMEIDNKGNIIDYRIVKSVINSKKKMNYDDVNKILEKNEVPEGYESFSSDLKLMNELSKVLSEKKKKDGYINFASDETEFVYDENGKVESITLRSQHSAEKMVENFMIVTNCTVAEDHYWKKLPFIYRNHGTPDEERLFNTIRLIKGIGYRIEKISNIENPKVIQRILEKLSEKEEFSIISFLFLKAMQIAYYSSVNKGHYGVGAFVYTHFTSPIRRITDLTIHILMDLYSADKDNYEKACDEIDRIDKTLNIICSIASTQERRADTAEYQGYKLQSISFVKDQIGDDFEAFITDIGPHYIKIRTTTNIDGIINLNMLNIKHSYKPENKAIFLNDYGYKYLIGNKINVTLKETSVSDLELYFTFPFLKEKVKKRTIY